MGEKYEASKGTRFFYSADLRGLVSILTRGGDNGMVPIDDLVEFVEAIHHGSEIPTGNQFMIGLEGTQDGGSLFSHEVEE